MPDDFGDLEQEIMARIEEDRQERQRRAQRALGALIKITEYELTPAEREGLSTGGVRIPPSPADDAIGLVDPRDGTLRMYSRAEIRAKVRARAPGQASFDCANGYAGTFDRSQLRREVDLPRRLPPVAGLGRVVLASAATVMAVPTIGYLCAIVIDGIFRLFR